MKLEGLGRICQNFCPTSQSPGRAIFSLVGSSQKNIQYCGNVLHSFSSLWVFEGFKMILEKYWFKRSPGSVPNPGLHLTSGSMASLVTQPLPVLGWTNKHSFPRVWMVFFVLQGLNSFLNVQSILRIKQGLLPSEKKWKVYCFQQSNIKSCCRP